MTYWTDYPILELGDKSGKPAPIRKCRPIAYDRDKYCCVQVGGIETSFKAGYIYTEKGRSGEVPVISSDVLHSLPPNPHQGGNEYD